MSTLRQLHPQPVSRRRHTAAWAVIVSLVGLLLGQPFHAPVPAAPPGEGPTALAAAMPLSQLAPAHDADLCSFCRASAQTRLGLRAALRAAAIAATGPSLALHLPAAAPIKAAPLLRPAQPRAPPVSLPLLAV